MTDDDERILDEATEWLLRLTETPGDRAATCRFQQWLKADPRHASAWKELNLSYDLIGATEPQTVGQWHRGDLRAHGRRWFRQRDASRRRAVRPVRPVRKRHMVAVAASMALTIWLAPAVLMALRSDYTTGTGQLRTVRLEDGSTARLGPASAIRIGYAADERRIELLSGEAWFEVEPNKARPFRVEAGDVTSTVLGTGFDVRRLAATTEVAVKHGRVRVDVGQTVPSPVFLDAGDRARVSSTGDVRTDRVSPLMIGAWTLAEVNSRDRTVAEVIDDMRPWYRGAIIIASDSLAARRVNGVFSMRNPADAIRSLVLPLGGNVERITPWLIIIRD